VSEDGDGPIEWWRPVPPSEAAALAEAIPELPLRTEPAHREAFVDLGPGGETSPAQWKLVSESLRAWAHEHAAGPSTLGARISYLASTPLSDAGGPDCDFAVPFD
jgi:hypothetical protein